MTIINQNPRQSVHFSRRTLIKLAALFKNHTMEVYKIIQAAEHARANWNGERVFDKGKLLTLIGEMPEDTLDEFCREVLKLQHHKDTTVGLYATDKDPANLLAEFWQQASDACPLEATEQEAAENEFHDFTIDRFYQIEY